MILNSDIEFDNVSKSIFGNTSFNSLASITNKVRFELGGNLKHEERISIANERAIDILNDLFNGKSLWLRIILWDKNIIPKVLGSEICNFLNFKKEQEDSIVLYFNIPLYNKIYITQIVSAIIGYEMGLENGLNINCFFYTFETPIVANIYDDRGMDVIVLNKFSENNLKEKYFNLITS